MNEEIDTLKLEIEKQFIELSKEKKDFIKIQEFYNNLKTNDIIEDTQYQEHLDVAKWLFKIKLDDVNVQETNYVFAHSCLIKDLEVTKWLLEMRSDVFNNFHCICNAFCFVCKEYYACFKCGWNYKTNKNIDSICYPKEHLKKYLRCKKHI